MDNRIVINEEDFNILINLSTDTNGISSATIETDFHDGVVDEMQDAQIDAIESLILAHAHIGIDIKDHKYIEGIKVAMEAIDNNS